MALEGKIKEFGIPDILQLISQQQKTGILTVEQNKEKVDIYLIEGKIAGVHPSEDLNKNPLTEKLAKAKLLSFDDLKKALDIQQKTFEYLEEILIKEGLVKKQDLEKIILNHIYETFYDIFQWKEGRYRFTSKSIAADSVLIPSLSIESILLDVLRMIDEWPEIKSIIPSFNITFQKYQGANPQTLTPEESIVFNLVNGQRKTQQIIDESLLGRFDTCKILSDLFQRGYIHQITTAKAPLEVCSTGISPQKLIGLFSYGSLVIILLIFFILPTTFPENILPALNPANLHGSYLQDYRVNKVRLKILKALELYRVKTGSYPESLRQLIHSGILHKEDIMSIEGIQFIYIPDEDSYTLKAIP